MSLATVHTQALNGIDAVPVTVEVHVSNGLPAVSIVGLPEAAVRESKERVRAAIINSQFEFPARRITINLAPADLPKEGGRYDLPIALGILAASDQIPTNKLNDYEFHGELALSGELRPIKGALAIALGCRQQHRQLVLPCKNATEAALINDINVFQAAHLLDVCKALHQQGALKPADSAAPKNPPHTQDMQDIKGQQRAKRALKIAAAGQHNLLMIGPPGTGKTMLASRLLGILPPMSEEQALQSAAICSISHSGFDIAQWQQRPFRCPHHTSSGVALVGGGSNPKPGEISLAHHGALFLDELTQFDKNVLDVLREPLETGRIHISRAAHQAEFPAKFQLIAAMNPCPQGYSCDGRELCQCTAEQQQRHRARISAPLLDRIDIHIEVPRVSQQVLQAEQSASEETSAQMRQAVCRAHQIQLKRADKTNNELSSKEVEQYCRLQKNDQALLNQAMDKLKLSARAYHRILKLARTIADLDNSDNIQSQHLSEAISYRSLDRLMSN